MAEIRLSRRRGLTFGTSIVDNKNGVYLLGVSKPSSPTLNVFEISAPGRDGEQLIPDKYFNKEITATIGIYHENIVTRRSIQRSITRGLLGKTDKLYFHDEPTLFHIGKVCDEITETENDFMTELEVKFRCKPFIYEVPSNGPYKWEGVTGIVNSKIINDGNFDAKPVIHITGSATNVSVTISNYEFTIKDLVDEVYIDTENMNVYKHVDGILTPIVSTFSGAFPIIPMGENDIKISGVEHNVSVFVDFLNTYIC